MRHVYYLSIIGVKSYQDLYTPQKYPQGKPKQNTFRKLIQ